MTRVAVAVYVIAFLTSSVTSANAFRILGIFPVATKSHFSCNRAMLKSLHAAGHQVTMITPFAGDVKQVENFNYIHSSRNNNYSLVSRFSVEEFARRNSKDYLSLQLTHAMRRCYDVLKVPKYRSATGSPRKDKSGKIEEIVQMFSKLRKFNKIFDGGLSEGSIGRARKTVRRYMMMEMMIDFECYLPIAEKLGIPVIGTVTRHRHQRADYMAGLPNNPAVLLHEATSHAVEMSFVERVQNLYYHFITDYHYWSSVRNEIGKFYREHFAENLLYKKQISLAFYNHHLTMLSRVSVPNVIDIGGIHLTPAKPLRKDLLKFIDDAPAGVIFFSLGSALKGSSLPKNKRRAFLAAFASIPQRVIWKFEEPLENLPKNIMISNWLPQRDILEHKNVIAFITHCGQSGIYEAIVTGTPVVTVPIFADQRSNAAILHYRGVGVDLNFETITEETVRDALNCIINDTSYYQRMQELSRVFQDRPMTPQESVVYWTEYVVKHHGAPHLKALGTDMPFYKYFMLDIIGLALLFTGLLTYTIYKIVTKVFLSLLQKRKYPIASKKDK